MFHVKWCARLPCDYAIAAVSTYVFRGRNHQQLFWLHPYKTASSDKAVFQNVVLKNVGLVWIRILGFWRLFHYVPAFSAVFFYICLLITLRSQDVILLWVGWSWKYWETCFLVWVLFHFYSLEAGHSSCKFLLLVIVCWGKSLSKCLKWVIKRGRWRSDWVEDRLSNTGSLTHSPC